MKSSEFLFLCSLSMVSSPSLAGPANMMGVGLNDCREMVRATIEEPNSIFEYFQWIAGYMSGLNSSNIVENKRFKDLDGLVVEGQAGAIIVPILRACRDNPDAKVASVVEEFYRQLPSRDWFK